MPKSKDMLIGQAEALDDVSEREAFEAWAKPRWTKDMEFMRFTELSIRHGEYISPSLRDLWACWQARALQAAELRAQAAALPDVPPDQSAVIAENEACAKACEELIPRVDPANKFMHRAIEMCIEAIRARHK